MKMESQFIFNVIVGIAAFFGGWVLNNIHRSIDRLDVDVRALPHTYVTREDYKEDIRDVREMLTKIFDKLDHKQDK